jgi:hypothetical protein
MDMLKGWHDFFVVLGAAAGTLIGAMFVVVSIGSGLVRQSTLASRVFVTPTIIHLAVVLLASAFVLVPSLDRPTLGAAAGTAGIIFLGYAARNIFHIYRQNRVHWSDHLWYGISPVVGYLVMIGGAVLILEARSGGVEALAFALALLVICGIRNAWDLILFFLERQSDGGTLPPP